MYHRVWPITFPLVVYKSIGKSRGQIKGLKFVKKRWRFRKNFVAFSEYMNFTPGQKAIQIQI